MSARGKADQLNIASLWGNGSCYILARVLIQLIAEISRMELTGGKMGGMASACHVFFPPTHAGDTTSASLPAGKLVASLCHSFPLLFELHGFEEQH